MAVENWFIDEIKITDKNLKELDLLLRTMGIKTTSLKKSHLLRRVRGRMMRTGYRFFPEYLKFVHSNWEEKKKLQHAFSINVTRFFRDVEMFNYLQNEIFPKILARNSTKVIKIWSAGCADGAEPYTLAILCNELKLVPSRVEILATDFNQELLNAAQKGIYLTEYLTETPSVIQKKYFTSESMDKVRISPILRPFVNFRLNNITADSMKLYPRFDLILCRNVLIYFSDEQKKEVIRKFHQLLKPSGFLILGMTEILHSAAREGFIIYMGKFHIYMKDQSKGMNVKM
ncbi:MAG: CheR family methyltransferase [Promethearchaeota archaeon]